MGLLPPWMHLLMAQLQAAIMIFISRHISLQELNSLIPNYNVKELSPRAVEENINLIPSHLLEHTIPSKFLPSLLIDQYLWISIQVKVFCEFSFQICNSFRKLQRYFLQKKAYCSQAPQHFRAFTPQSLFLIYWSMDHAIISTQTQIFGREKWLDFSCLQGIL